MMDGTEKSIESLSMRYPLRSASLRGDKALFLDSAGTVTVLSLINGTTLFSFSSIGALDAAFLDDNTILLGRTASSGNTPFLTVNMVTGETVSIAASATIGTQVYGGSDGSAYGAVVEQQTGSSKTAILKLNLSNPPLSIRVFESDGENTGIHLVDAGGVVASNIGGNGLLLHTQSGDIPAERTFWLPRYLVSGGDAIISADADGVIAWYEPQSGKLLAMLHLYEDAWLLETPSKVIKGKIETAIGRVENVDTLPIEIN
jgi:hypothetical protein